MSSAFDDLLNQTRQRLAKMGVSQTYATHGVAGQVDGDFRTRTLSDPEIAPATAPQTMVTGDSLNGTVNGIAFSFRPKEGA